MINPKPTSKGENSSGNFTAYGDSEFSKYIQSLDPVVYVSGDALADLIPAAPSQPFAGEATCKYFDHVLTPDERDAEVRKFGI